MPDDNHPLLEHLDRVEAILRALANRKRLSPDQAEEFASHVRLKLWEGGEHVIRQFQGRSSWATYWTTVVTRLFLDYRRQHWGRWRPSAAARRLGPVGTKLERLLYRDRIPFDQAAEILRRNDGVEATVAELAELAGELPAPGPDARRMHQPPEEGGLERLAPAEEHLDPVEEDERAEASLRTREALAEILGSLDATDRFLVQSLTDGLSVAEVARMLGQPQKPLYRRRERLVAELRRRLEARGLTEDAVPDRLTSGGDCRPLTSPPHPARQEDPE